MKMQTKANPQDVEGIWVTYKDGEDEVELQIARAGNPRYLKAVDRFENPHRRDIQRGRLKTETQIEINCRAMSVGLLRGWKEGALKTEDGDDLEFNEENAYLVLRYNPGVRDFVMEVALDEERFRSDAIETTAKKSRST